MSKLMNYVVEYKNLYPLEYLKLSDPEYDPMYSIIYIFDRKTSTLSISGDYGFACFCWYSAKNTLKSIAEYSKSVGYFASKCKAGNIHHYDYYLFSDQLDDFFKLKDKDQNQYRVSYQDRSEMKNRLLDNFDEKNGLGMLSDSLDGQLSEWEDDWWESLPTGRVLDDRVSIWAKSLQVAMEKLGKKYDEEKNYVCR